MCLAIARTRDLEVAWVRAAFLVAVAFGGFGVVVYSACWLIVPSEREPLEGRRRTPGVVVVAQACAACAGLAALALLGASATVFGFGWAVVGLAAAAVVVAVASPRLGAPWVLVPIVAALTLPSLAVAASGLRLAPQLGDVVAAPRVAPGHVFEGATYRTGLGELLVDLRRTPLPAAGTIPLRIEAGVRRTIVALPHDRCVHVRVASRVTPFLAQSAALLSGRDYHRFFDVAVFGRLYRGREPRRARQAPGPTLTIGFTSMGGGLYVRDYPDDIQLPSSAYWPGFRVTPEPRPSPKGQTRRAAASMLRAWRVRVRTQIASKRAIDALLPGPCARSRAPEAMR